MRIRNIERMTVEEIENATAILKLDPTNRELTKDQAEVFTALMHPDFVGTCFPQWFYKVTTDDEVFNVTLTNTIAISESKKNQTISCKVFDLGGEEMEESLGDEEEGLDGDEASESSTCRMIHALGKLQLQDQLSFKQDSGKKIYKKIVVENDDGVNQNDLNAIIDTVFPKLKRITHCQARQPLSGICEIGVKGVVLFPQRNMPGMDLHTQAKISALTEYDCLQIGVELFKALQHQIKNEKIIHRDIKPENIMVFQRNKKWNVEIVDYDDSRDIIVDDGLFPKTRKFAAPELLDCESYDESVDIYSAAITLMFAVTSNNKNIFIKFNELLWECAEKNIDERPKMEERLNRTEAMLNQSIQNEAFKQLLMDCTQADKNNRPKIGECVQVMEEILRQHACVVTPAKAGI